NQVTIKPKTQYWVQDPTRGPRPYMGRLISGVITVACSNVTQVFLLWTPYFEIVPALSGACNLYDLVVQVTDEPPANDSRQAADSPQATLTLNVTTGSVTLTDNAGGSTTVNAGETKQATSALSS